MWFKEVLFICVILSLINVGTSAGGRRLIVSPAGPQSIKWDVSFQPYTGKYLDRMPVQVTAWFVDGTVLEFDQAK